MVNPLRYFLWRSLTLFVIMGPFTLGLSDRRLFPDCACVVLDLLQQLLRRRLPEKRILVRQVLAVADLSMVVTTS